MGGWVGGGWVVCKPILVFSLSLGQAEQLMNERPNIFFMPIPYQTQGLNSLTLQKPTHRILTSYYVLNPLTSFWSVVGGWWVLKGILMFCVWSNLKLCSRPRPKLHNWFMYSIQSKYTIILQRTSFPNLMQLAFFAYSQWIILLPISKNIQADKTFKIITYENHCQLPPPISGSTKKSQNVHIRFYA